MDVITVGSPIAVDRTRHSESSSTVTSPSYMEPPPEERLLPIGGGSAASSTLQPQPQTQSFRSRHQQTSLDNAGHLINPAGKSANISGTALILDRVWQVSNAEIQRRNSLAVTCMTPTVSSHQFVRASERFIVIEKIVQGTETRNTSLKMPTKRSSIHEELILKEKCFCRYSAISKRIRTATSCL